MIAFNLQAAIYQKLQGTLALTQMVKGIYDHIPQHVKVDNPSDSIFPYIIIGDDTHKSDDTDTELGFDSEITIHIWTRYLGLAENKQIQGEIYKALHRKSLSISGYHLISMGFVDGKTFKDADGLSQHGVQTFRLLTEEL